jgi:type III restriction enzyme
VVDRLNIIAHDKFQEVVDEAGRGDSPIRLKHWMRPALKTKRSACKWVPAR